MERSIQSNANLRTDNSFVLLSLAVCLYVLLVLYHGFIAFGRDTIETVPYALWMADQRLFASDFHLSHLRNIFPNERWIIAWSLHFFAEQIKLASWVFHGIFSLTLLAGMLRVSDHILRNIELGRQSGCCLGIILFLERTIFTSLCIIGNGEFSSSASWFSAFCDRFSNVCMESSIQ